MLPQNSWTKAGLCCDMNCPAYTHSIATKPLSTVSTISSNYHPPLIDMNNNRRKLVNGEHNCPRQKAKHRKSHFFSRSEQKATSGLRPVSGERYFTTDIHLPPESHFITGSPIKQSAELQKLHFHSLIHNMSLLHIYEYTWHRKHMCVD